MEVKYSFVVRFQEVRADGPAHLSVDRRKLYPLVGVRAQTTMLNITSDAVALRDSHHAQSPVDGERGRPDP